MSKCIIIMDSNDESKEINIKNSTSYYFDDLTRIEDFDLNNVLIDEKSWKNIQLITFHNKL